MPLPLPRKPLPSNFPPPPTFDITTPAINTAYMTLTSDVMRTMLNTFNYVWDTLGMAVQSGNKENVDFMLTQVGNLQNVKTSCYKEIEGLNKGYRRCVEAEKRKDPHGNMREMGSKEGPISRARRYREFREAGESLQTEFMRFGRANRDRAAQAAGRAGVKLGEGGKRKRGLEDEGTDQVQPPQKKRKTGFGCVIS